jgi:uncharacterized damage-inducible protein DinB
MSLANDLLIDGFSRVQASVHDAVGGLTPGQLEFRVDPGANTVAWLVWHLARVQDDHIADVAGSEQVWRSDGWVTRFDLPFDASVIGFGQTSDEVAEVRVESGELLTGYYDAVHEKTVAYLGGLADNDYERVVDETWDPPVTLAARLVSILNDDTQHVGQAAFLRGVIDRSGVK